MIRFGILALCCFVLVAGGLSGNTKLAEARDAKSCSALAQDALSAAKESCSASTANSLCFGYNAIKAAFAESSSASPNFKTRGDKIDLSGITSVSTSAANPDAGQWGVAVLKIQAGLPTESQGVTAVLFGDATMTSTVRSVPLTTLPVTTRGDTVLLRGGAGTNYPSGGRLTANQSAVVDGRNKAGDWLRVRLDNVVGWASVALLKVTGDIQTLTVLDDQDSRADFLYTTPMQAFTLTTTGATTCASEAPSGLLLQLLGGKGDKTAHLSINGADIAFSSATLAVRAAPKDRLDVTTLAGSATVSALGSAVTINAGEWTRLRLGGKDGLAVSAGPTSKSKYPFAAIDGAPVGLLGEAVACTIGLPASNKDRVAVRVGPGQERGPLFFMQPDLNYKVSGWAEDIDGAPWWKLDIEGNREAWVAQSAVHSIGACDQIAKAEIPPVIVADSSSSDVDDGGGSDEPEAAATAQAGVQSFAPKAPSIWTVVPGQDQLVGTCAPGTPVINYCPSLVQLSPRGTGLTWKGQELRPYNMTRVRANVYGYTGPAPEALGRGTIKLTLVFTSPTTWTTTRVLSLRSEPGCQHVYTFTGTFLR